MTILTHRRILDLRAQGLTYQQIAERVGLSAQRVGQVCRKGKRKPK